MRVEVVGGEVLNHLLVDTAPRRPFNAPENALGDNLAALDELSDDDRAALLNHLDALDTRTRLHTLADAGFGRVSEPIDLNLQNRLTRSSRTTCPGSTSPTTADTELSETTAHGWQ